MKNLSRSFLVSMMNVLLLAYVQLVTTRTWFQEITDHSDNGHAIFNKFFHRCSLNEHCNFIVRDLKKNIFKEVLDGKELPTDKKGHAIWKKAGKAFQDCKDAHKNGMTLWHGALDLLWGNGTSTFRASCDMTTDGGGWTVIQRRVDANVSFDRNWDEYVNGFGDPVGNHWLGLEAMHRLTKKGKVTVRFDLKNKDGSHGYAEYKNFKIAGTSENYKITIGEYRGNVGDAMNYLNGTAFTTKDKNNDKHNDSGNCAVFYKGAWWMAGCTDAHLNNLYPGSQPIEESIQEMTWYDWKWREGDITFSEMKIK